MTDAPEPATNVLHGVSVIGSAEAERGPAQRTALGLAMACFGLVIFGLGIADLLRKVEELRKADAPDQASLEFAPAGSE